ncbi:MAG: type II secretion system protein GspL, partial [Pseudomonadota bacterium]
MAHYIFIPDCNTLLPSTEARYDVTHHGQPSLQTVDANGTLDRYLATQTNTADGETIIVIPLSRIAFIDALLPRVSAQKRNQLVNFAIEDKLTIDPSTMHVVVIGPSLTGANRHIIAAISRPWLLSVTTWLQQAGVSYRTVLPETALFRVLPDEWLVILDGSKQGMAIRSDGLAYALDADNDSKPPFQLTLALNEAVAAESGHAVPTTLRLRLVGSAPGEKTIDCDRWQQCLGKQIPIILERRDAMANVPDDIPVSRLKESNLLVGQFLPAGRGTSAIKALKPAWILGSVILFLHVLFVSVDAWQLDHQRRQIESAMRQQFLSSFPEATT